MEATQRLRIVFAKGIELKYVSHLDLLRIWERVLRRARAPLAYSQGFNPRPRLFFAAALPVGCTGRAEMLDLFLERRVTVSEFVVALTGQLAPGLQLVSVRDVQLGLPPLPSLVAAAEYEVRVDADGVSEGVQARIDALLAASSIPRRRERPGGARSYDLRPLIQELRWVGWHGDAGIIRLRLQSDAHGTGRPDEVMAALGMSGHVLSIDRVRLVCPGASGE